MLVCWAEKRPGPFGRARRNIMSNEIKSAEEFVSAKEREYWQDLTISIEKAWQEFLRVVKSKDCYIHGVHDNHLIIATTDLINAVKKLRIPTRSEFDEMPDVE
jgi:hypothetical protein